MTEEEKDLTPQIFLNNEKFNIPEEGMLGLLTLGDVGLKMWRMKRSSVVSPQSSVVSPESSEFSPENLVDKKELRQETKDSGLKTDD